MDWFFNNVSVTSQCEVTWFSDEDKNRINRLVTWFSDEDKNRINRLVLDYWGLKDRMKITKLEEITQT